MSPQLLLLSLVCLSVFKGISLSDYLHEFNQLRVKKHLTALEEVIYGCLLFV